MTIVKGNSCKRGHDGRRYTGGECVQCHSDASKRMAATPEGKEKKRLAYWKTGGKETRQARNLKANYGITIDQYNIMLLNQNNCCAICKGIAGGSSKRFHVDHDHQTGAIRGLLCYKCNMGLGSFDDNPNNLASAISYLYRQSKSTLTCRI